MTPYGKMSQTAIAAISCLAEHFSGDVPTYLGSADIARLRHLPAPAVRKALTTLSQANLVTSAPGPGGGFVLAKPPGEISLLDIVKLFERQDKNLNCPLGPNWCGSGPQCPLHEDIAALREQSNQFLKDHNLAEFLPGQAQRRTLHFKNNRPLRRQSRP